MADYIAQSRSNYFKVKDIVEFKLWLESISSDLEFISNERGVGFLIYSPIPSITWDEKSQEYIEFDFHKALAKHLQVGEVAITMEVGYEKIRYLIGVAVAVNHRGKVVYINLDEIYDKAKKVFKGCHKITNATY